MFSKPNPGAPKHLFLPGPHEGIWNAEALDSGEVILCEAPFDALTFWVNGFKNVTFIYGTEGFTDELFDAIRAKKVQLHPFDGYWEDIGTIRSYYQCNLDLASGRPPFDLASADAPNANHGYGSGIVIIILRSTADARQPDDALIPEQDHEAAYGEEDGRQAVGVRFGDDRPGLGLQVALALGTDLARLADDQAGAGRFRHHVPSHRSQQRAGTAAANRPGDGLGARDVDPIGACQDPHGRMDACHPVASGAADRHEGQLVGTADRVVSVMPGTPS